MRICIIVYRTWAVSFVICIADFTKTFERRIVKRKTQSYKTHVNIFWQQWHTNRISWWGAIFWYLVTIATYCSPGEDIWHNGTKIAKTTVTWHNGSLCFEQWMIPLFAAKKNTFRLQWTDLSAKRTWILQDFATPNFSMPGQIKGNWALEAKVY